MSLAPGFHGLWPTPIGVYRLPGADELNPLLARVFGALRLAQAQALGEPPDTPFFASDDDLLQRLQLPEGQRLVRFIVDSLQDTLEGRWFQCSRAGAFHDAHTHGNCSWSGVYVVQLGGTHVDLGNAYLQPPHVDVAPVPGQLVVFLSWLPHQALPYDGRAERIVVSFNASVHAAAGSDRLHGYAAT